jgi:hypothetical protein
METPEGNEVYTISIPTGEIRKAIKQAAAALYDLIDDMFFLVIEDEDNETDFVRFARETRNVLGSHLNLLSFDYDDGYEEDAASELIE